MTNDLAAISSGTPYRVTRTDGQPAMTAADFLGNGSFLIHLNDQHARIGGVGALDAVGTGVRFYEKDFDHEGRDVRIWHIRAMPDQQIVAEHEAAI
ncbi:MAG: hypothetical protein JWM47_4041 [Acidimicrobiales bacterium]|jgi:hypothetical protein|nr:hypothetical protein [Acidimicrobiales bacterium]